MAPSPGLDVMQTPDHHLPLSDANFSLREANLSDLETVLNLVLAYHHHAGIEMPPALLKKALIPLLGTRHYGRIWLSSCDQTIIGYICLCFGYSLEFAGRDAFIDELYIVEEFRGRGLGRAMLAAVMQQATALKIAALHLEVASDNTRLTAFYRALGFEPRHRYNLLSRNIGHGA